MSLNKIKISLKISLESKQETLKRRKKLAKVIEIFTVIVLHEKYENIHKTQTLNKINWINFKRKHLQISKQKKF